MTSFKMEEGVSRNREAGSGANIYMIQVYQHVNISEFVLYLGTDVYKERCSIHCEIEIFSLFQTTTIFSKSSRKKCQGPSQYKNIVSRPLYYSKGNHISKRAQVGKCFRIALNNLPEHGVHWDFENGPSGMVKKRHMVSKHCFVVKKTPAIWWGRAQS